MEHKDFIKKYFPNLQVQNPLKEVIINTFNHFGNFIAYLMWDNVNSPEYLYHYTSMEALSNILQKQKLWLFHFDEMNDPNEVVHGIDNIQKILKKLCKEGKITKTMVKKSLDCFASGMHDPGKNNTCFFSLTKHRDYLPFWRWYGDDGKGACIKIDGIHLTHFTRTKIIYDEIIFRELVELFILDISEKKLDNHIIKKFIQTFTAVTKKEYYQEENEWRLFPNGLSELKSKEIWINNKLRKYNEISLTSDKHNHFPITEIIVGPSANPKAVDYLKRLTESLGLQIDNIEQSEKHYNNASDLAAKCLEDRKCMLKTLAKENEQIQ